MKDWAQKKVNMVVAYIQTLMSSERGDTNFISILIILGVVILVAAVFMGFKDQIVGQVTEIIDGFTIK